jgi:hypothetical protein
VPPAAYSSPGEENNAAEDTKESKSELEATPAPAPPSIVATTAVSTRSAPETTVNELKEQLAKAESTIAALRSEASSGLRQRKTAGTDEKAAAAPSGQALAQQVRQGTEGVPIHIVALLCFVSFLLAYFFF